MPSTHFAEIKINLETNPESIENFPPNEFSAEEMHELYLLAVTKRGDLLKHVPENQRTQDICLAAVQQNWEALQYTPTELQLNNKIWLTAISKNGYAIKHIPKDKITRPMCFTAVTQNGEALQYVPENLRTSTINRLAVEDNWRALQFIPLADRAAFYQLAISQDSNAIQYFRENFEINEFYIKAVTIDWRQLKIVPVAARNEELCLIALQQNAQALSFVPDELFNADFYYKIFASWQELFASGDIQFAIELINFLENQKKEGKCLLSSEDYQNVCNRFCDLARAACKIDTLMLPLLPINFLSSIIDPKSLNKNILYYDSLQFLLDNSFDVEDRLANIQHVVVTKDQELFHDAELKDIFLVYANAIKRDGLTMHVNKSQLEQLLEKLTAKNPEKNINLVLLGHASANATNIANMQIDEITTILNNHSIVNKVTLLGCNTAKSKRLTNEKEVIVNYSQKEKASPERMKTAIILMSRLPSESEHENLLKSLNKKTEKVERAFIISELKKDKTVQYKLTALFRDGNNITTFLLDLNTEEFAKIRGKLTTKGHFPFPKSGDEIKCLRGSSCAPFASARELLPIYSVLEKANRFDRLHYQFKQTKNDVPFLRSERMNTEEAQNKLNNSLFKILFLAIQAKQYQRDITIKGYTKSVHVDTVQKCLQVTRTHLYPAKYRASIFYQPKNDFINREKLATEQNDVLSKMRAASSAETDDTTFKALIVTIKGTGATPELDAKKHQAS